MSTPAYIRVFEIQELTDTLTSFLDPNDIVHLMRTSRDMHTTMEPCFYRNLRTFFVSEDHETKGSNLCESREALAALARNIHHVKRWSSDLMNLIFFLHATCTPTDQEHSPSTLHLDLPTNLHAFQWIALPPMVYLTKLDLDLSRRTPQRPCQHYPRDFRFSYITITRLCTTLQRLSHIRELDLKALSIKNHRSLDLFSSTLLGMIGLTVLQITFSQTETYPTLASALFFSCPPSVKFLSIWLRHPQLRKHTERRSGDDDNVEDEQEIQHDADRVFLPRRTTPLTQLRDLHLGDILSRGATDENFLTMFEHCPGLEHLVMYWPSHPDNVDGAAIGRICPNLRHIYYAASTSVLQSGAWLFKTITTIPENQLETFDYGGQGAPLDIELTGGSLARHGHSLKEIRIDSRVHSKAIRRILNECAVLEYLEIGLSHIELRDAVAASPWASSRITTLKLNIGIDRLPDQPGLPPHSKYKPYYLRTPPVLLLGEEKIFERLEVLYREIGKQKELRRLQLDTKEYDEHGRIVGFFDEVQPFPGMLRLMDNKNNNNMKSEEIPGYLELLSGLSKLEEISGAVVSETNEQRMAEDVKEVDWILKHWPLLRTANFFPASKLPRRRM